MTVKSKNILIALFIGIIVAGAFGIAVYYTVKRHPNASVSKKLIPLIRKGMKLTGLKKDDNRYLAPKLDGTPKEGIRLYVASSLDKIFQDGRTLVKPNLTYNASLSLAKNEYESFQIIIQTGPEPLNSVYLDISDLINNESGTKIAKKNVTWKVVGYVQTQRPYYPVRYVGMWPDPLLSKEKIDVKENNTQPLWVTVYVPKATMAGDYKGTITLVANGIHPRNIPFDVHVYDFTLPRESSLKTAFDFYGHEMHVRYPQKENETKEAYQMRIKSLNDQFIVEMLKNRMNPVLNIDPTSEEDLTKVDKYRWYGLNNFSIGKRGGTLNNNWPSSDEEIEKLLPLYRTYGEYLKLNKMLDYHYIYTWDEGEIGNPTVAKIANMIHRAYPGLKNMVCYHGFWDPYENPDWGKDIDIWCFQIGKFNENKMNVLVNKGLEIWMYVSGPGGDNAPNLVMDFESMSYRIIPWMCWRYNWKGFLYWCVNWWVNVDPFKSAVNTKWSQNANGLLFYPGKKGPVNSLRTEVFRDGMEDYEYFVLLKKRMRMLRLRGLLEDNQLIYNEALKLLSFKETMIRSTTDFIHENKVLQDRRNAIAEKIEVLTKILLTQISPKKVEKSE